MTGSDKTDSELVINVLLHEYDTLRDEIVSRTSSRFQLVGLAAVAATIVTAKWGTGKHDTAIILITIGATLLAAAVIWVLFLFYINRCAERLAQIEDELNMALGCSALIWESYHGSFWSAKTRSQAQQYWQGQLARAGEKYGKLPWEQAEAGTQAMTTAIVQYKLPPHIGPDACAAHFRSIAPGFRDVPGLIRKQFIYADDGWAGGVYLWQARAAAEAFYTGPWLDGIRERYGMDPQIKFFETACITDNMTGSVLLPDMAE